MRTALRPMTALTLALGAAACGNDGVAPPPDLAVAIHDLAVPSDLSDTPCPATPPPDRGPCLGRALCRYPTDAGPFVHYICVGGRWDFGNCPWGPYNGASIPAYACTSGCNESFAEAYITCECLPTGVGACCIDTGGGLDCEGYGDAGHP